MKKLKNIRRNMSHPSKQKGNRFEREIVDKAKDIGLDFNDDGQD